MSAQKRNLDQELISDIAGFTHDPDGFVYYAYPWGNGDLKTHKPRAWQREVLQDIGNHLSNPETRHQPCMVARSSGHGIGKSALIAWIIDWGMSTFDGCKVVVTANTESQLRTKTWPEITKWFKKSINSHWWSINATSIHSIDEAHKENWRTDAITWSKNNTESFAGLHNQGKRIIVIMDEASAIDDKVWEVAEGALTDADTEIIWIVFGNPTRSTGRFRECFRRFRDNWNNKCIDSRDVEGTNKQLFERWVKDYGEDSDFIKVRVKGQFPSQSMKQFISEADVDAAYGRHLRENQYAWAPKILTLDPAWEGDDKLVIGLRQGLAFKILRKIPKNDNDVEIANILARIEDEEKADAVFIDGGYGTGVVSVGRTLKRDWQIVWFSGASNDPGCLNKRAEMWKLMRDWLKEGGAIPEDTELRDDLIGPETVPRLDGKIQIESKKDMKDRGLPSPNCGDALALSFAYPVAIKNRDIYQGQNNGAAVRDYDPFSRD